MKKRILKQLKNEMNKSVKKMAVINDLQELENEMNNYIHIVYKYKRLKNI